MQKTSFGKKLRKLRMEKGLSQQELSRRLGHTSNSYVFDVERGKFLPSEKKLKEIAKAMAVPYPRMRDLRLETRLEQMGITEPRLLTLLKKFPRSTGRRRLGIEQTNLGRSGWKRKKLGE